ncbi:protein of unknown function [Paenibacillus uliginis N3/975]|uniref:DUF4367 domain-containing protein n=1 Tax=Paenibacillus uliginis N3/975 TaxID=1313296 RepID=A0A1X7HGE2_9BACL|nr:DUF4367 domain-containing protein [Paenibacillus uliginis]SMF85860.1 protein of unknown function [Paenibacillus uliginis N3/975]
MKTKTIMTCMLMVLLMCSVSYAEPNKLKNTTSGSSITDGYGYSPLKIKEPIIPKVPKGWSLVTKTFENCFVLVYLDQNDEKFIVSISEYSRRPITPLTNTKHTIVHNTTYFYDEWQSNQRGWMLRWVKGDIYFEMNSATLNVDEMIKIAETLTQQVKE